MSKMRAVKSWVAMLLVVCMVTGIVPVDALRAAVAYAQTVRSYDPGDFSAVLESAHAQRDSGGVSSQGEWQYVILPEYNYAVITGHTNASATDLTVPDMLGGADVVGIAKGALAKHAALVSLMLPGNLYAIDDGALPEGIIIRGYNASYAQTYASQHACAFERVAEFDFRGGVVDYADIRTENFVRVSQHEVRLRALEAERLAVGKRFFLIDPNNAYAVSFYQVAAMSEPKDGFVTITCDTPEIEQVLRNYSGENEKMVVDRNSLILYDGVKLTENNTWSGRAKNEDFGFDINLEIDVGKYEKFKVSGSIANEFKTTYSGSIFGSKTVQVKHLKSAALSLSYMHKDSSQNLSTTEDRETVDSIREKLIGESLMSGKAAARGLNLSLGTGFVFSYAGLISAQVVFGFKASFSGGVEVTCSMQEETTYSYKNEELTQATRTLKKSITGSIKATIKFGVVGELNVYLLCAKVFAIEAFVGIKTVATHEFMKLVDDSFSGLATSPVNMWDCVLIEINFLVEIKGEVGLLDLGLSVEKTWTPVDIPLGAQHLHLFPVVYAPAPDEPSKYVDSGWKNQWHKAAECPYDLKTVRFVLPFVPGGELEYLSINNLYPKEWLEQPKVPTLEEYDRQFLAWHTDITCNENSKVNWPYQVEDNVTLYANTALYHSLNYVYTDGTKVTQKERHYAGEEIVLPDSGDEREIVQWAVADNTTDHNVIRFLPENAAEYTMPDEDSTLLALCSNDVEVRFYTGIGTEFRRMYMAMDSQLQDPGHTDLKKPRFKFVGWTDIAGNPITFPLTLKERNVNLYAHWEYDDTITAVELNDSDIGQRFTFDVPVDEFDIEVSEDEDADIYGKIFEMTEIDGSWRIDGVLTNITYKDVNGETQTLVIDPKNVVIPERIKHKGKHLAVGSIGSSAFTRWPNLRAVTLLGSIKELNTAAFYNCKSLELIDLSSTGVTKLPDRFANNCTSLKAVLLPREIETIGQYAFENCTSLKKANVMADLDTGAFKNCTGLTEINIGKHPTPHADGEYCGNISMEISSYAFQNCTGLTELFIPDNVGMLGDNFILGCKNLQKITFDGKPLEITEAKMMIGPDSQLNTVIVGEGVKTLGAGAFRNGDDHFPLLNNLTLPSTIESIGANAFEGAKAGLLQFYGNNLKLDDYAFANSDVEEVIIHTGNVGSGAFYNCDKLKKATIGAGVRTLGASAFSGCDNLTTVIIEEGVQTIGAYAFSGCKSLTALAFPDSVTSYGNKVIQGCTSLEDLTIGGGCAKLEIREELIYSTGNMAYYPPFYIGKGAQLKRLEIRDGVREIGKCVFANTSDHWTDPSKCFPFTTLETLILPDSLMSVGELAFYKAGGTELTIPENMVSIGQNAFSNSPNLKKLVINGDNLAINGGAFQYCDALETVELNEGVKSIGTSAFFGCSALQSMTMKEGVRSIGNYAFNGCASLKKLVFPDSVTSYGEFMISGCKALEDLTIGGGCAKLEIRERLNYASGGMDYYPLFYIGPGAQLKRLEIREGVTEISKYVFANTRELTTNSTYCYPFTTLETVILPQSLETIGNYAFYQAGMVELTIPENVQSVGQYAFSNSATLKNLVVHGNQLEIGSCAFMNCTALETAVLDEGVKSIGNSAFYGCEALQSATMEEGVRSIGSYAFYGCKSLTALAFPDSVTSYGQRMILGCKALEDLTIGGGCEVLEIKSSGGNYYSPFFIGSGAQLKRLEIREGVTEIGKYTFANTSEYSTSTTYCYPFTTLETLILPESLTTIGELAFYHTGITELTIPAGVSSMNQSAFADSTRLKALVVYGNNLALGSNAFSGCTALESVVLEEGVRSIGSYAFRNCKALKKLECSDTITSYGANMIAGCTALEDLIIGGGCAKLEVRYSYGNYEQWYPPFYIGPGAQLKRLEIREGVTEIGKYVFANASRYSVNETYCSPFGSLETVILPESLTTIGEYAFYGTGMTELTIPQKVSKMDSSAFSGSEKLRKLVVKGENLSVSSYAFQDCKTLETVVLGEGVISIGNYAFAGCTALKSIQISEGVKSIGDYAFRDCAALKRLVFPDSVTSYGDFSIRGCTGLEDLTIGGGCAVLELDSYYNSYYGTTYYYPPFYIGKDAQLKRLEIREGVTEIGEYVFANASQPTSSETYCHSFAALESVTLPESLKKIGNYAFYQAGMTKLTIPAGVNSIGQYAFANCARLKKLVVYGNGLGIGSYAFQNCTALENVELEEGVRSIGSYAFKGCTALKRLECADSITSYGSRMIEGCTALEDLTIGGGCAKLKMDSYYYSSSGTTYYYPPFYIGKGAQLKRLEIREGVTEIGQYVFANTSQYSTNGTYCYPFTTLESVILPESLTTIGSSNISQWPGVKTLHLGANVASLTDSGTRADLTIYTDAYSAQAEAFAAKLGSAYVVRDPSTYPTYTLRLVSSVPATIGVLYVSDGTMLATRGLEGETALLDAGYAVLGEETVAYGDPIAGLAAPQADGYVFGGWYADAEYTIPWNGERMTACDLTLYARMLPVSDVLYAVNIPDAGTADARLPQGYSLYALDRIAQEDAVNPPVPVVEGRTFDAWYHDEAFTMRWWPLFDRMPEGDLILYGRFVPQYDAVFAVNLPADVEYQSAELPDGFSVYQTVTVTEGEAFQGPAEPVVSGYVFTGWYEEPSFEHAWDGQRMPEGGTTVYGKMMRLSAGGYYTLTADGYQVKEYLLEEDESSEVYLPAKIDGVAVVSIADYAFGKDEITVLHLPENLAGYSDKAFASMSRIKAFVISANNPYFATKDGVLYSKDMTTLYRYPAGKSNTRFAIPAGVTKIDAYAFENCKNLKTIAFPDSLAQIGEFAFSGCERLTAVSLPDGVTSLPSGVFDGCHAMTSFTAYGLTEIVRESDTESVTPAIPFDMQLEVHGPLCEGALRDYCVMVDKNGVESMLLNYNMRYADLMINGSLFGRLGAEAGMLLDADYEYGETDDGTLVVGWYKDNALSTPWNFATDTMPDENITLYTTTKPVYEYESCTISRTETAEDGTETTTDVTGLRLTVYHGEADELSVPRTLAGQTVIALGEGFLAGAKKSIGEISIGESVIEIADTALEMTAPYAFGGVVYAEAGSYAEAWALEKGYECLRVTYKITYVTGGAALSDTDAPMGADVPMKTPVKAGATFAGWYLDEALTVPVPLNENGKYTMPGEDITFYAAWEGEGEVYPFTYEETASGVTVTGYTGSAKTLTIPETVNGVQVTAIAAGAFENDGTLERITLPDSLTVIGERAFAGSKLITAELGGAQDIGASAFEDCIGLTYLTMDSAQVLGENAFAHCILLRSLPLPEGLSAIGDGAFAGCTGVGNVTLPDGVSYVGDGAFEDCAGLKTIDLTTAYYVSPQAFDGCTALHTISASGTYASEDGVLMTADGGMLVRYPQAKADTAYAVPETVTMIAPGAFAGVSKLAEITLPAGLEELGEGAFRNCTALTAFDIPAQAPLYMIPEQAFIGCYNLERVTLSDSVQMIDDNAFLSCMKLSQITIPESVVEISGWAFGSTDELVITGKTGSAAHTYALEHDIMFTDPDVVQAQKMTLSADTAVLQRGETLPLALAIEPAEAAETTKITWRSGNPSVVAVSDGLARAIGGGTATVYAIANNGVEASYEIEVQVAATGIELAPVARMARGQTAQAEATILPLSATDRTVTYQTGDENVFTVDESGMITATGEGIAQLTAVTHNGLTAQTDIEVYNAVESIEIVVPDTPLYAVEGLNTLQLTAVVLPEDATTKDLQWSVADEHIASVDAVTGLITAAAPGETIITASAQDGSGVTGTATVIVQQRDISGLTLPELANVTYDAQAHVPQFVLEMDGLTLVRGTDYQIEMADAVEAGEHPFTVMGTGKYCGAISGSLTILPATTQLDFSMPEVYRMGTAMPAVTVVPAVPYIRELARVEEDGTLTPVDGVQEPGAYRLTIRVEETASYSACELETSFTAIDNWLVLSSESMTLNRNQTVRLGVKQLPADMEPEPLVFSSSSSGTLTIDTQGCITAKNAGSATITISTKDGGVALQCKVKVMAVSNILRLPGMLREISEEAFAGSAATQMLILGDSVERIDSKAFADMPALVQAHLPQSVTQIAEDAFAGNDGMIIVCPEGSAAQSYAEQMEIPYVFLGSQ